MYSPLSRISKKEKKYTYEYKETYNDIKYIQVKNLLHLFLEQSVKYYNFVSWAR